MNKIITAPSMIAGYFDIPELGSGYRHVLVIAVGKRWVRCLYVPRLAGFRIELRTVNDQPGWKRGAWLLDAGERKHLHRTIRSRARRWKKMGSPVSDGAVQAALAVLSEATP